MQGMAQAIRNGAIRRHERLGDDLSAKDAADGFAAAACAAEKVNLELFNIKQADKLAIDGIHRISFFVLYQWTTE